MKHLIKQLFFEEKEHQDIEGWKRDGYVYFLLEDGRKVWFHADFEKE